MCKNPKSVKMSKNLLIIRNGKEDLSGRNKKRACDRITDFVKYTDLSNRRIHRWLRKRTAYAGMRSCLCASDPGTGTVVSSFFKHVSTFWGTHLINNMLVLFVLGQRLEPAVGRLRFLLIYIAGGLGGNFISLFWDMRTGDYSVSAGASGAVFAVMGGMIYVIIRHRGRVADLTMKQMLIMAAFSLYFGFASEGVDNAAHAGGLLCGFLAAVIFYHPRKIWKTVP